MSAELPWKVRQVSVRELSMSLVADEALSWLLTATCANSFTLCPAVQAADGG